MAPTLTKWVRRQEVREPLTRPLTFLSHFAFVSRVTHLITERRTSTTSITPSLSFSRGLRDTSRFATWTGGGWRWCCKRACRYRDTSSRELPFVYLGVLPGAIVHHPMLSRREENFSSQSQQNAVSGQNVRPVRDDAHVCLPSVLPPFLPSSLLIGAAVMIFRIWWTSPRRRPPFSSASPAGAGTG